VGLILGRRSVTLQGLQIHPGEINQDYMGELKILAQAPQTFIAIAPIDHIAQLVLFPNIENGKLLTSTP
jgi:dUTPase